MLNVVPILILLGIAAVFAYHAHRGWRKGVVRYPLGALVFQEVESTRRPEHFWGVIAVNAVVAIVALTAAALVAWNALPLTTKPLNRLSSLDGCYEGEGTLDFMRPRLHRTFKVRDGQILNRQGRTVSSIQLHESTSRKTLISFSPGIVLGDDEHKETTVYPGEVVRGEAYLRGSRAEIALADEWGDLMLATSCS